MKLPNAHLMVIDAAKVRDYLLSGEHPVGRFKARFFRSLGYSRDDWAWLERDLLAIGRSGEADSGRPSQYGQKCEVRGSLTGPSGGSATIVTVWIVPDGEEVPRFVTAFPEEAR